MSCSVGGDGGFEQRRAIHFCELFLRDGIQGWPKIITTKEKLGLLQAIDAAGVPEIDLTSFVPAKFVPQFADAEELLGQYEGNARIRVLTVNVAGAERVIHCHRQVKAIQVCGIPFSASEAHNKVNLRCDHATHRERVERMVCMTGEAGITPMVCVATAWGCPLIGEIAPEVILEHVDWLQRIGVTLIMLGDTTGVADPARVKGLFSMLLSAHPQLSFIAHFHDNRGCGIANTLAAVEVGVKNVDGCLGGLGGEPASIEQGNVGESGNVVTEDLILMLNRMSYSTDIDLKELLQAGQQAERVIGRQLFSKALRLQNEAG